MRLDPARMGGNLSGQTVNVHSFRQVAHKGKRASEAAVHEDQFAGGIGHSVSSHLGWRRKMVAPRAQPKRRLRDRREIREAPVFLANSRKAFFVETIESHLAQLANERGFGRRRLLESAEAFRVMF